MSVKEMKSTARRIVQAALAAAEPQAAVTRSLQVRPDSFSACGVPFPVSGRLIVAAVGKAASAMTAGALSVLAGKVDSVLVVLPRGYSLSLGAGAEAMAGRIEIFESSHPVPDEAGLAAARRLLELVSGMGERDTCLLLLSGGGSSLLPLPRAPLSLQDKIDTTRLLLHSGADIREINTVRKHISAIKGGRLAEHARGRIATLAISDVVGDAVQFIASGPTVPDSTTFAEARDVLSRYSLGGRVPAAVAGLIEDGIAGRVPETPKSLPDRHSISVIASNTIAVEAAMREAALLGFAPLLLTTFLGGEAREAGRFIASIAREVRRSSKPLAAPACIFAGGETTVTVRGSGQGGRNQELALAAAMDLEGAPGILITSFATDGKEGNTDAAGAFASGETVRTGLAAGRDPHACLAANDSHTFLAAAGDLLVTGPTGTNVNDISFALVEDLEAG